MLALVLPSNSKTQLERVSKGKPFSLLGFVIFDEGTKFYNIDTRAPKTKRMQANIHASIAVRPEKSKKMLY